MFQLSADRALVATVDFFAPVVDDAYAFGAIAAANAFSDLYAMGATPLAYLVLRSAVSLCRRRGTLVEY